MAHQYGIVAGGRSEEHTSELQSQFHLVCRLLLEKKKNSACSAAGARPNQKGSFYGRTSTNTMLPRHEGKRMERGIIVAMLRCRSRKPGIEPRGRVVAGRQIGRSEEHND